VLYIRVKTKAGCARNPNFCFLLVKCVRKVLWLYSFVKSGFTENLAIEAEKRENVRMVRFEGTLPS
jgi:hypothetical protein